MKLSKLRIENFRSFKDETIDFDYYTCLVGANGTGKSATGELSAKWCETHMKEFLAEMEQQAKSLFDKEAHS